MTTRITRTKLPLKYRAVKKRNAGTPVKRGKKEQPEYHLQKP